MSAPPTSPLSRTPQKPQRKGQILHVSTRKTSPQSDNPAIPNELLAMIIGHLSRGDQASCALVNKRWLGLTVLPLWKQWCNTVYDLESLKDSPRFHLYIKAIRSIKAECMGYYNIKWLDMVPATIRRIRLKLERTTAHTLYDAFERTLVEIAQRRPGIETLEIVPHKISRHLEYHEFSIHRVLATPRIFQNLTDFKAGNMAMNVSDILFLGTLPYMEHMQAIVDDDVPHSSTLNTQSQPSKLRYLELQASTRMMAQILPSFPHLETIDITFIIWEAQWGADHSTHNAILQEMWQRVFPSLGKLESFRAVFESISVDDNTIAQCMALLASYCPLVKVLALCGLDPYFSYYTEDQLISLLIALPDLQSLQIADVHPSIGEEGWYESPLLSSSVFEAISKHCPKLWYLTLGARLDVSSILPGEAAFTFPALEQLSAVGFWLKITEKTLGTPFEEIYSAWKFKEVFSKLQQYCTRYGIRKPSPSGNWEDVDPLEFIRDKCAACLHPDAIDRCYTHRLDQPASFDPDTARFQGSDSDEEVSPFEDSDLEEDESDGDHSDEESDLDDGTIDVEENEVVVISSDEEDEANDE